MSTAAAMLCLMLATIGVSDVRGISKCTKEQAIRAEMEADTLQSWNDVYRSYKKYAQCDDAAIGEGYSDSVSRLLEDHWDRLIELNRITSRDKKFLRFVLFHIDELMSMDAVPKIRGNAVAHCPAIAKGLCKSILTELNK
jgi:hypothetical protein